MLTELWLTFFLPETQTTTLNSTHHLQVQCFLISVYYLRVYLSFCCLWPVVGCISEAIVWVNLHSPALSDLSNCHIVHLIHFYLHLRLMKQISSSFIKH